jgi:asparagine synthase (glutamine-hydrolysing)
MCGITGIWHLDAHRSIPTALLQTMTTTLRHRGPDDEGYYLTHTVTGAQCLCAGRDTSAQPGLTALAAIDSTKVYNLGFGFRRLAILDLSPAGHQPMATTDERCWIVYNGEIYNYRELRTELEALGHIFRTGTDTEVILNAYAAWGEACLARFNGMWAFALWDLGERRLFCARDRFGVKPFYYFWNGQTFAFASEIKALLHLPELVRQPNDGLIYDYLRYGRTDHTAGAFLQAIHQLPPAHWLALDMTRALRIERFWALDPTRPVEQCIHPDDAARRFTELFTDSVRLRLRSDVPVGTCLSGGLDSSSIVCVANRLLHHGHQGEARAMGKRQQTFSSCYEDPRFDERIFIEAVLQQTGAAGNYTFPNGEKLIQTLPRLIWHQDEPFGGLSIFAQWCVMELASRHGVTVLLDGQGGDELLAGYHPCFDYHWAGLLRQGRWGELGRELQAYRRQHGGALPFLALRSLRPFAPAGVQGIARRLTRGSGLGVSAQFARCYTGRRHEFVERDRDPLRGYLAQLLHYSIPMLLRFEDRNSMAHAIEARVPFLDYRLVEYAFTLPAEQKIHNASTKAVLRRAMAGVLPETVRQRKDKMGFVAPERVWLNEDLRAWSQDLVHSRSFRERPYFNAKQIAQLLADHYTGRRDLSRLAWRWFNLELWLRQFVDSKPVVHV